MKKKQYSNSKVTVGRVKKSNTTIRLAVILQESQPAFTWITVTPSASQVPSHGSLGDNASELAETLVAGNPPRAISHQHFGVLPVRIHFPIQSPKIDEPGLTPSYSGDTAAHVNLLKQFKAGNRWVVKSILRGNH